ncbi:hypothetical protein [Radicibacter daui]|uniref:hypothetical protein n=1 Tax=Radicibacter daui TaxID=3064829 RepID=UPI004046FABB
MPDQRKPVDLNQLEAMIGQAMSQLSPKLCYDLWQAVSSGALGEGGRVEAVRRGLVSQINRQRADHARRLFLSCFEPLLVHDPAVLALGPFDGMLHVADMGALYLTLLDHGLKPVADRMQEELGAAVKLAPVDMVMEGEEASVLRAELLEHAGTIADTVLASDKLTRQFLLQMNQRRNETVRTFLADFNIDPDRLHVEHVEEFLRIVKAAPALIQSLGVRRWRPSRTPDAGGEARRLLGLRDGIMRALPSNLRHPDIGMWPAFVNIHHTRNFAIAQAMLPALSPEEVEALGQFMQNSSRSYCWRLRHYWGLLASEGLERADAVADGCQEAIDGLLSIGDVMLISKWPGSTLGRRSVYSHIQELRRSAVEVAGKALADGVRGLISKPQMNEADFSCLARQIDLLYRTATLGSEDMQRNRALELWRHEVITETREAYRRCGERIPDELLLSQMVRLADVVREIGEDPSNWIFISSITLVRGATAWFGDAIRPASGKTAQQMEQLAFRAYQLALKDQTKSRLQWKDQDLTRLRNAAQSWATRHGRLLPEPLPEDDESLVIPEDAAVSEA